MGGRDERPALALRRRRATTHGQREPLAVVLTEASALAGWEALDRNALQQAWNHHQRAKAAALEATSPPLYAHALAQQAFILLDLGETNPPSNNSNTPDSTPNNQPQHSFAHGQPPPMAKASPQPATETKPYTPSTLPEHYYPADPTRHLAS